MNKKVLAKRADNDEWVCGDFFVYSNGCPIVIEYDVDTDKMTAHKVKSDSIKDISDIADNDTKALGL